MNIKKSFVVAALVACGLGAAAAKADTIYDLNQIYADDVNSVTPSSSANGLSVGYVPSPNGAFTSFSSGQYSDSFFGNAGLKGYYVSTTDYIPTVVINTTSTAMNTTFGSTVQAGQMLLHPGGISGSGADAPLYAADVRYTIASAGLYSIDGLFSQLDNGQNGTTLDSIYVGGVLVSSGISSSGPNLTYTATLAAGTTIDFIADVNLAQKPPIGSNSTGLFATVTAVTPLPKAGYAGLGLLTVLGFSSMRKKAIVA